MMKKILIIIMSIMMIFTATACGGGKVITKIDPNKKQIYVEAFDGGYGYEWLQKAAEDFNAIYTDYEVVPSGAQTDLSVIYETIKGGYSTTDIYFAVEALYTPEMIDKNLLHDLTAVYDAHPDGEDKPSIREKVKNYEFYKNLWSNEKGIYSLPYSDSLSGLVYDHDIFVKNKWLNFLSSKDEQGKILLQNQGIEYEIKGDNVIFKSSTNKVNYKQGDYILQAGKDGKYGTYDDGQPQNMDEWNLMFELITSTGYKPFIWSGEYQSIYMRPIIESVFAQYDGPLNYDIFFDFDGTYSRTGKNITIDNGYEVYDFDGLGKMVDFTYDYLTQKRYKHSVCDITGVGGNHGDAQNNFIMNFKTDEKAAMLVEGIWWENEAKDTFKLLEKRGEKEYKYGTRDYRYMLLPFMEGQLSVDGKGNGSVLAAIDTGNIYMVEKNEPEEMTKMKEKFIAWTCKDEYLRYLTKTTGALRPFNYEMTAEDLQEMTIFNKNVYELYSDTENIQIVRPFLQRYESPLFTYGGKNDFFTSKIGDDKLGDPILAYKRGYTKQEYLSNMKSLYKAEWNGYINKVDIAYPGWRNK